MAILIKDMDMPECCAECPLNYELNQCAITGSYLNVENESYINQFDRRLDDCPLEETEIFE